MIPPTQRKTALILQFPPPGARRSGTRGDKAMLKQNGVVVAAKTSIGGGAWYHEAAILEDGRPLKS